jgi:putative FmdB family regulatory protein
MPMKFYKYHCRNCGEIFEVTQKAANGELICPKCLNDDLEEYVACSLAVGPPPWEFLCRLCGNRFRVTAPKGPDEVKAIRCPVCRSSDVKWLALAAAACATGG